MSTITNNTATQGVMKTILRDDKGRIGGVVERPCLIVDEKTNVVNYTDDAAVVPLSIMTEVFTLFHDVGFFRRGGQADRVDAALARLKELRLPGMKFD